MSIAPDRSVDDLAVDEVERADEGGDEAGARRIVDFARRPDLLDRALVHHDDAVGHRQRFFLIVGDEDRRDAELALQRADFLAQRDADARVEGGQRLVEQQDLRARGERAGERDALLLAARQLIGIAVGELRQLDHRQHLVDPRLDLGRRLSARP